MSSNQFQALMHALRPLDALKAATKPSPQWGVNLADCEYLYALEGFDFAVRFEWKQHRENCGHTVTVHRAWLRFDDGSELEIPVTKFPQDAISDIEAEVCDALADRQFALDMEG